ncbi:uncharacterized protein N7518_003197 [Penicillium psychrosexuale]|uniref:uncharacterized protein n=1 Tax=Penicillium psychrosexuale TaxID=1002107 RepID=UPI002545AC22|nr:uncharacterized protein N7518_003197 [Penicillium psychrosexuale]KAJ5801129.1 hypothetical protein N7518_003197 [Penicillium psychrosexuale]
MRPMGEWSSIVPVSSAKTEIVHSVQEQSPGGSPLWLSGCGQDIDGILVFMGQMQITYESGNPLVEV